MDLMHNDSWNNRNLHGPFFKPGDLTFVMVQCPKHKFAPRWQGPFKVAKKVNDHVYVVELTDGTQVVKSLTKLKHYKPAEKYASICRPLGRQVETDLVSARVGPSLSVLPLKKKTAAPVETRQEIISSSSDDDDDPPPPVPRRSTRKRTLPILPPPTPPKIRGAARGQLHSPQVAQVSGCLKRTQRTRWWMNGSSRRGWTGTSLVQKQTVNMRTSRFSTSVWNLAMTRSSLHTCSGVHRIRRLAVGRQRRGDILSGTGAALTDTTCCRGFVCLSVL